MIVVSRMQHNVLREFLAIPFIVVKKLVNATIATHLNLRDASRRCGTTYVVLVLHTLYI